MNHDAAHCSDYIQGKCPPTCYRARLTQELKDYVESTHAKGLYSFSNFKGTQECPRWPTKMEEY